MSKDTPRADAGNREHGGAQSGRDGAAPAATAWAATAWSEAETRAAAMIRSKTGDDLAGHLRDRLRSRPGTRPPGAAAEGRMLALGANAGAFAIEFARQVPGAAMVCLDNSPERLRLGRQIAAELALDLRFVEADPATAEFDRGSFDLVFCHALLHQIIELEPLMDRIARALRPDGRFVAVDLVTRNSYRMRPETRDIVRAIWPTLPARFRLNHTAYAAPLIDDRIWEPDIPPNAEPDAAPAEILPVIERRFATEFFVPYFSLSRRFFDTMYGPNYDLAAPLDQAVFNWVWQLDVHYLETKRLRPEAFFGMYRAV